MTFAQLRASAWYRLVKVVWCGCALLVGLCGSATAVLATDGGPQYHTPGAILLWLSLVWFATWLVFAAGRGFLYYVFLGTWAQPQGEQVGPK